VLAPLPTWPARSAPLLCQHRGAASQSPRGTQWPHPGVAPTGTTAQTTLELVLLRAALALLGTQAPHAGTFSTSPGAPGAATCGEQLGYCGHIPFCGTANH